MPIVQKIKASVSSNQVVLAINDSYTREFSNTKLFIDVNTSNGDITTSGIGSSESFTSDWQNYRDGNSQPFASKQAAIDYLNALPSIQTT